jgi:hypothetical protein
MFTGLTINKHEQSFNFMEKINQISENLTINKLTKCLFQLKISNVLINAILFFYSSCKYSPNIYIATVLYYEFMIAIMAYQPWLLYLIDSKVTWSIGPGINTYSPRTNYH